MEFSLTGCASCGNDHDSLPFKDDPNGVPSSRFVVCPKTRQRVYVFDTPDVGALPCTAVDPLAARIPAGAAPWQPVTQDQVAAMFPIRGEAVAPVSPMPLAAEGVTEARKRVAEAEDYARLRLDGILVEARAICAVVGLVPLSKLDGIVELVVPAKPRKKRKATSSRPALNRGLPKGEKAPRP